MSFEWDSAKAGANVRKHGVAFEEASTASADPLSRTIHDPQHSVGERRFVLLGRSSAGRRLVVVQTERGATIRRTSARIVTDPSASPMKKTPDDAEMLPEYDFSRGVREQYAARMAKGSNVILLDPDVQRMFPDSATVDAALLALAQAVAAVPKPRRAATVPRSRRAAAA